MAQTAALVRALKNVLKARGITYARVAKGLKLSEASVKRIFAQNSFTLERLDQICDFVGIEISDLARIVAHDAESPVQLTWEQENEVVSDTKLLLVAVHALNHWTMDDMMSTYALSKAECTRLLAKLDRIGIIDLMPDNKIRLKVARGFRWLPDGPIQQYFRAQLQNDFFTSRFDANRELMVFVSGMLSHSSNAVMQSRLKRLRDEFSDLHEQDLDVPFAERFGTTLLMAMRPWTPETFKRFRKQAPPAPARDPRAVLVRPASRRSSEED